MMSNRVGDIGYDAALPDVANLIAGNLRRIRRIRGISLAHLSREANVARGTLHQLESGLANPRMDTLFAVARVLEVALSDLVDAPSEECAVVRASEAISVGTSGLDVRLLRRFSLVDGLLELCELRVANDTSVVNDAHLPGIYEHVLVTSGRIRTGPVGSEAVLEPGDYMKFRGDLPHKYAALDGPVVVSLLMEYPTKIGIVSGRDR